MKNICEVNSQNEEIFYGIDLFKLIFAILIVFMHTYCQDLGDIGYWNVEVLASVGVPFFFIVSGFFYTRGLYKSSDPMSYFKKYFKRMLKLYLIWTVISLPIFGKVIVIAHGEYSLGLKIVYLIRSVLFSGSIGVYWYILSLLYISIILYFVYTHKKFEGILYILSCIFFIIGVIYAMGNPDRNQFFHLIHAVFGSERNFLTVGLFYTSIGYYFAHYRRKLHMGSITILLLSAIVLKTIEVIYFDFRIMQVFVAVATFLLAINLSCSSLVKYSKVIRKFSTAIYLEHFLIILVFDFNLQKGTWIDFTTTLLISILIYGLTKVVLPEKISRVLFGA